MREKNKKDIGGYFELEKFKSQEYYTNYLDFSSGRNSFLYIIKKRNIQTIYMPYYLCDSVFKMLKDYNITIIYYHIDSNFLPMIEQKVENAYVYIVNYFGLLIDDVLLKLKEKYHYVIFDYTHSFYRRPIENVDTIYNCRKYFGVPDGSYLATDLLKDEKYYIGKSFDRIEHLFGRYEQGANEYYDSFKQSELSFEKENLVYMSKLTHNLLGAVDYKKVKKIRSENFKYLNRKIGKYNLLFNKLHDNMDFMYPFMIECAEDLREILIENHIYTPTLWPNLLKKNNNSLEYYYASHIIFLPIDQRYNFNDMDIIINVIMTFIKSDKE